MAEPLIWGAGAIGGAVAAYLARAGHAPVCVDVARDHVAAINERGLTITGPVDAFTVPVSAHTPETLEGAFDVVLLCVKAHHTAAATRALAPHLAADGCVVSLQNGLNELVIADMVGRERTVGAFINFSADWHEPGVILYGGRGAVVVGELDGRITPRIRQLHALLRTFDEDAVVSESIFGYLWGKLIYGSFLKATALSHQSIADGLANSAHRDLFVGLAREILAVADSQGIRPQGFDGFDPDAFRPGAPTAELEATLDAMIAFNRASAKTHSGTWRDLAVRRRRTDAAAQLDPMLRLAEEAGLRVPLARRLLELITDIEEGRREQGEDTLDALRSAPG